MRGIIDGLVEYLVAGAMALRDAEAFSDENLKSAIGL